MGTPPPPLQRSISLGLCAVLLLMTCTFSNTTAAETETFATVVGTTECLDCEHKSIKNESAVKGLRVVIKCKVSSEKYETKAASELDSKGDFNVKLLSELLQVQDNGELKHECFAQLHSSPNAPCPGKNSGLNPNSKLILKSREKGRHTFVIAAGKLSFSSATCVSANFWPPYSDPWRKFPKYPLPPFKFLHKRYYPRPIYSPPVYTPPTYKPPSSGGSHHKPSAPVYKPPTPAYKPPSSGGGYNHKPPAPPVYKPPSRGGYYKPPTPVNKPPTGGYNKPTAPVHKPTPVKRRYHPIYKKLWPPIPQLPPFYHPHPKFYFPPIYKKPLPQFPGWPPYSHWHKYFHKPGHPPAKVHQPKP
ncbi:hypothetical protein Cni_G14656 [Canna indica]|uniref:Proline-rich protein n=1 Tax=Canna indica TaxID=4628 RepID=A0AAQ3QEZ1_9LILI|nr:hypothetical protein Cni_G14656 [Canna indica]